MLRKNTADRDVKRSIKRDKVGHLDNIMAKQAETAADHGYLKEVYLVAKKLAEKFQQTDK